MNTQKVTVNAVMPKVSQKGANYQQVVYNGALQAVAGAKNGDFTPYIGKEVEVELETSSDGKTTFIRLPGMGVPDKKPFTPYQKSDPVFELRKAALVIALDACKIDKFTPENLVKYTKQAEKYLQTGEI